MKAFKIFFSCILLISFTSCQRNSNQTWEDVKTAGSYLNRSIAALFGQYDETKAVCEDETDNQEDEFISLNEADLKFQGRGDFAIAQPKFLPGEKGSALPSLSAFRMPNRKESSVFQRLYFATDDHIVRSREDLRTIQKVSAYLKNHPNCHICIEGHCDERAPAAYNMALGSRRANQVRVLLIKQGVKAGQLYPISYGKEKPWRLEHSREAWAQNRRCEFKLYTK